jgi:PAS domain S-box-containing protein
MSGLGSGQMCSDSTRRGRVAFLGWVMRDQHRPKQELINEVVALRKQVVDLKEATAARRRVEDALRHSEEQLRALVESVPVGLCLFRPDGALLSANGPFARMLGYESPAELLSVSQVFGTFGSATEQARVLALFERKEERIGDVLLRRKDGRPHAAWVMGAVGRAPDAIALVVLEPHSAAPDPQETLSDAWSAGTSAE